MFGQSASLADSREIDEELEPRFQWNLVIERMTEPMLGKVLVGGR